MLHLIIAPHWVAVIRWSDQKASNFVAVSISCFLFKCNCEEQLDYEKRQKVASLLCVEVHCSKYATSGEEASQESFFIVAYSRLIFSVQPSFLHRLSLHLTSRSKKLKVEFTPSRRESCLLHVPHVPQAFNLDAFTSS